MIQPRAGKPDAQNQRRRDVAQALVEIGAVLFGNLVQRRVRQQGARRHDSESKSPITASGISPAAKRRVGPAIGGDNPRRQRTGSALIKRRPIRSAPPIKCHRRG